MLPVLALKADGAVDGALGEPCIINYDRASHKSPYPTCVFNAP